MYEKQELGSRLLLLHQISEFAPECEVDDRNWQFFSRLFQGFILLFTLFLQKLLVTVVEFMRFLFRKIKYNFENLRKFNDGFGSNGSDWPG